MNATPGMTTQHPQYGHQDHQWTSAHVQHGNQQHPMSQGPYTDAPTATNHVQKKSSEKSSQDKRGSSQSSSKRYGAGSRYKRNRTIFNAAQLEALARIFQENQYPDAPLRRQIAERLDIDEERIQIWFQNRRAKTRRSHRKDNNSSTATCSNPDAGSMTENSPGVSVATAPGAQRTLHHAPVASSPPPVTNHVSSSTQQITNSSGSATHPATADASSNPVVTQPGGQGHVQRLGQVGPNLANENPYGMCHSSRKKHAVHPVITDRQEPTATVTSTAATPRSELQNRSCNVSSHISTTSTLSTSTSTSYTQHYVSNGSGNTSRVHVDNSARSTEGRLRPETRVSHPPPNQVCTQIPDKDQNELSKALFRFGVMIGQSAGLDVDASQLEETHVPDETEVAIRKLPSQKHLPAKKRRRPEYKYPNSDTSDSEDDNPRKRHRRMPNGIDRSGPPNRLATAVPESDRTLPAVVRTGSASSTSQELAPVFEGVTDLLIDETCSQIDKDALESPFSIDILSSPEPRSSPKSPCSTSSSSMSDWSDFDDPKTVSKSTQSYSNTTNTISPCMVNGNHSKPYGNGMHNEDGKAWNMSGAHGSVEMSHNVHPLPKLDRLPTASFQHSPLHTEQPAEIDHTVGNYAQQTGVPHHQSRLQPELFRHRSFSDHSGEPVPYLPSNFEERNPPNVTAPHNSNGLEQRTPHHVTIPQHAQSNQATVGHRRSSEPGMSTESASTFNNAWTSYDTHLRNSSSSSASEENRRNQVCEILAESRQIADHMSSSSPASPFSEHSGARSPASWPLPKSPQAFTYLQHTSEASRGDYDYTQANGSLYDHQRSHSYWTSPRGTSTSMTAMPPHTYNGNFPAPSRDNYPQSYSRPEGNAHPVIKPVAKLPSMASFPPTYRSSFGIY